MPDLWEYLRELKEFPEELLNLAQKVWAEIQPVLKEIEANSSYNQLRVLDAFRAEGVAAFHFAGSTGYGYGDLGREVLESLYASVFGAEAAIVRPQLVSGTHAIAAALFGVLRPGDELVYATGRPYDTLLKTIGVIETPGSLKEYGITYREVQLRDDGSIDLEGLLAAVNSRTKVVAFQRSRGYSWRPAYSIETLAQAIGELKKHYPRVIAFVDNCYGEFVEIREPSEVDADLVAGSLIKNPGGTLAPFGGYIVGRKELLDQVFSRLTAPGLGPDVGPTGESGLRLFFQGLYLAPHFVGQSLQGAVFAAAILSKLGVTVSPGPYEGRFDLIQGIEFAQTDSLIRFCQAIQSVSPVDSSVTPEPAPMAGYADYIIMSAGSFVQGASSELSADAPIRTPARLYLQGGSTKEQIIYAVLKGILKTDLMN
ncbi:MAG: methionine gamma-lyase family protein [Firmicutes bacterium]|nr:methionine gamma-lyase family protein [Bacillota bacterium]